MNLKCRLLVATVTGSAGAVLSLFLLVLRHAAASDFTWSWRAARVLVAGQNPYLDPSIGPGHPYPFDAPLFYPLHAVLVSIPFAWLPAPLAGALFFGVSAGLLAFGATREGFHRLPMFLSAPFFAAAALGQWSPLIMAAAFMPGLSVLALAKPNLGIPVLLSYPSRRGLILAAVLSVATLAILPSWPWDWIANLGSNHHVPPVLEPAGVLLIAALVGWRLREGRLLLLLALAPQMFAFYDQFPLWLIPRTVRQSIALTLVSWAGYLGWFWLQGGQPLLMIPPRGFPPSGFSPVWVIMFTYIPALVLVLAMVAARSRARQFAGPPSLVASVLSLPELARIPWRTGVRK